MNPVSNFVWAFIIPFICIVLANITFIVITARIMWHHQVKQIQKTRLQNVSSWLRSTLSLVVIMSITWILGILIIKEEALIPLAYIYTIMVAFQGVFIFLLFVVFSKAVREAYKKWWKVKVNQSIFLSTHFQKPLNSSIAERRFNGVVSYKLHVCI